MQFKLRPIADVWTVPEKLHVQPFPDWVAQAIQDKVMVFNEYGHIELDSMNCYSNLFPGMKVLRCQSGTIMAMTEAEFEELFEKS